MNATLRELAESLDISSKTRHKSPIRLSAAKSALARKIRIETEKENLVEANFHLFDYGNAN
jgi:hypothetical protein